MAKPAFLKTVILSLVLLMAADASAASRFTDRGDGTVMDRETGLMWFRDAMSPETGLPLPLALQFIKDLNSQKEHGYGDWRLPTLEELISLAEPGSSYPAVPTDRPFMDVRPDFYWTSSTGFNVVGYAWTVDMGSGAIKYAEDSYCNFYYVWPVRTENQEAWRAPDRTARQRVLDKARILPSYLDLVAREAPRKTVVAPVRPLEVSASAVSMHEIVISWKPTGGGPGSWYNVYSDGEHLRSITGASVSIKGLRPGMKKCFTVSARTDTGEGSGLSKEACATTWRGDVKKGTVWGVGLNNFGQLGDDTRTDAGMPVLASGLNDVVALSAGVEHVLAVRSDGTVWAWGRNSRGQMGEADRSSFLTPKKVEGLSGIVDVSAGWYHSLALASDGAVWALGRNYYGQLGDGSRDDRLRPVRVRGLSNVRKIASGWYHSMALDKSGNVWVWGWNRDGQLADPEEQDSIVPMRVPDIKDAIGISGGMGHSAALLSDGTIQAWGRNDYGQLGTGVSGDNMLPQEVKGIKGAVQLECGMHYCIALTGKGRVKGWGRNDYGQLGNYGQSVSASPRDIEGLDNVAMIAAGAHQGAAVKRDGSLLTWGWDFAGDTRGSPPQPVGSLAGFEALSGGVHYIIMLKGENP